MLGRIVTVILGCLLLGAGGYMLTLHLASGEVLRSFILLMGGAMIVGGYVCLSSGLRPRR